jgi:hypothetical protein
MAGMGSLYGLYFKAKIIGSDYNRFTFKCTTDENKLLIFKKLIVLLIDPTTFRRISFSPDRIQFFKLLTCH